MENSLGHKGFMLPYMTVSVAILVNLNQGDRHQAGITTGSFYYILVPSIILYVCALQAL